MLFDYMLQVTRALNQCAHISAVFDTMTRILYHARAELTRAEYDTLIKYIALIA